MAPKKQPVAKTGKPSKRKTKTTTTKPIAKKTKLSSESSIAEEERTSHISNRIVSSLRSHRSTPRSVDLLQTDNPDPILDDSDDQSEDEEDEIPLAQMSRKANSASIDKFLNDQRSGHSSSHTSPAHSPVRNPSAQPAHNIPTLIPNNPNPNLFRPIPTVPIQNPIPNPKMQQTEVKQIYNVLDKFTTAMNNRLTALETAKTTVNPGEYSQQPMSHIPQSNEYSQPVVSQIPHIQPAQNIQNVHFDPSSTSYPLQNFPYQINPTISTHREHSDEEKADKALKRSSVAQWSGAGDERHVDDFIKDIDILNKNFRVQGTPRIHVLIQHLKAPANAQVDTMIDQNPVYAQSYEALVYAIKRFYDNGNRGIVAALRLANRKQKPDESLNKYMEILEQLATRAFPNDVVQWTENLIHQCVTGVSHPALSDRLALNLTEKDWSSFKEKAIIHAAHLGVIDNTALSQTALAEKKQADKIKPAPIQSVTPAVPSPSITTANKPYRGNRTNPNIDKLCNTCGKKGHVSAKCRSHIICELCKYSGHTKDQCKLPKVTCKFCQRYGHDDTTCYKKHGYPQPKPNQNQKNQ